MAFAGNSVLCRLALGDEEIDATSFTIVRLLSGAIAFVLIFWLVGQINRQVPRQALRALSQVNRQKWISALMLFVYAAGFSFAYIELDTGAGALVLFGIVQLTMISVSLYQNDKLPWFHLLGIVLAFMGLCYLIFSQSSVNQAGLSFSGFVFMIIAGIAWGAYTLFGRGSTSPFIDTGVNFVLSVIFCLPLLAIYLFMPIALSNEGLFLAISSGIVTSALGYSIWYIALPGLSRVQAGVVQLLVPIIAAFGGIIWVGEEISRALVLSQIMVLGGIALVMKKPKSD